jgi:hypothetical protein
MAQAFTFRAFGAEAGVFTQSLPQGGTDFMTHRHLLTNGRNPPARNCGGTYLMTHSMVYFTGFSNVASSRGVLCLTSVNLMVHWWGDARRIVNGNLTPSTVR